MTRPEIIRADTIDLQDRVAPSAKDHYSAKQAKDTSDGSLGAHQAETLREVAAGTAEDRRLSWGNSDVGDLQQYAEDLAADVAGPLHGRKYDCIVGKDNMDGHQQQDALAIAQNGGQSGTDTSDDGDLDGDEDADLDDDMMDKISSSPSIEDGGYTRAFSPIIDALHVSQSSSSPISDTLSEARSSSPYLELPEHLPLRGHTQQPREESLQGGSRHHHLCGQHNEQQIIPIDISTSSIYSEYDDEGVYRGMEGQAIAAVDIAESTDSHGLSEDNDRLPKLQLNPNDGEVTDFDETDNDEGLGGCAWCEDMLTVPYDGSSGDDDDDDFSFINDSRFIDSGWGGECLHDAEDIDFEFVYALHTFVATVEGQANATKGDTMVLLDDSNSYWWLVRVVKDSSIGYLPAEHIETPTERLARLNKHRNIDLSATMLGDQAEKTKPTIRVAMRRRKKTVTFAAPTYVDYSDIDYSTDEEDVDGDPFAQQQQQQKPANGKQDNTEQEIEDESAKVEPLKPRPQKEVKVLEPTKDDGIQGEDDSGVDNRISEEIFEASKSETPGPTRTKDGTVRDSFFKDDTVETKKITLTPNLLRDDGAPRASTDSISKDSKARSSLDKLDKELILGKDEKKKKDKDKKDKNKKSSGIRGFFSRKDKKGSIDEDDDPLGKRSMEIGADYQEKQSEEFQAAEDLTSADKSAGSQRHSGKLQKQQPRPESSANIKPSGGQAKESGADITTFTTEGKMNPLENVPPASMRIVEHDSQEPQNGPGQQTEDARPAPLKQAKQGISGAEQAGMQINQTQPQQAVKAKSRMDLDEFDSSDEEQQETVAPAPSRQAPVPDDKLRAQQPRPTLPGAFPDSYASSQGELPGAAEPSGSGTQASRDRYAESPVQMSLENSGNPPALVGDTSSQEESPSSPSSSPSPELAGSRAHAAQDSMTTSTMVTNTSSWNDAKLRSFFDSSTDIRNLLVVVYDKTDVVPAGPDHPVVGSLFREQNAKLAEITTQLDNMLGDWLARKQRLRGAV